MRKITLQKALERGIAAHKAGKIQEADRYYTTILNSHPKHPDANHNMGVLAVGVGKVEQALPFLKSALETNPTTAQYWVSYIDALINLNRTDDAKAALNRAKSNGAKGDRFDWLEQRLGKSPSQSNTLELPEEELKSLIDLYTQAQYQEALVRISELLKEFPNSLDLYNIIGAANKGLGKLDEAIEAFKKAISLKPNYAEAYNNMGNALKDQGKVDEAVEAYAKAISIKPDYAAAYYNFGNVLKNQGKLDEAVEAYAKAISIKPDYAEAHNNMGVALKNQGKLDDAVEAYSKAISIKPDYPEAHNNMSVSLQAQGKLEESIKAYKKTTTIRPDYPEAYNNMGIAFTNQGKLDEAVKAFKKALSIKPDYPEVYYNIGVTFRDQGKLDKAIEAYQKALSIRPDYGSAEHMLAALTGKTNKTAPREYVENLFDGYSKNFETSLIDKLEYNIPKLIRDILIKPKSNETIGSVLDLGCGTGLLGSEIKNHCSKLQGIDLSNKMLKIAKQKNVYDELSQADIVDYLSSTSLDFDYYIALDVFIYVGNLSEIFRLIKSRNKKPGKLVFSTEHTKKDGYHLLKSGRYSHSKNYIEHLCRKFDYNMSHFFTTDLRKENGHFLRGGIYNLSFEP